MSSDSVDHSLYLDLLQKALCASIYPESGWCVVTGERAGVKGFFRATLPQAFIRWLARRGFRLVRTRPFNENARSEGVDWPCFSYSMTGTKRLAHLRECVETVLREQIPGDFIETGVWRGGSVILMKAVLKLHNVHDRIVWAADSFEGLPSPTAPADTADPVYDQAGMSYLKVSLDEVRAGFERFGLLDEQVRFLKGWFRDTLPSAPITTLSILRLDGDMYESTRDALEPLYPKVSPGGFVIVDDYHSWPGCKQAIDEYRAKHNIRAPLINISGAAVFWRVER